MSDSIDIDFTNFHVSLEAGSISMLFDRSIENLTMNHQLAYGVGMLLLHASATLEYCEAKGIEPDASMLPDPGDHVAVVQLPDEFVKVCKEYDKHPSQMLEALVGIFHDGDADSAIHLILVMIGYLEKQEQRKAQKTVDEANKIRQKTH